uniref:Uncharacterized protein n=1 Tax=Sus scrofa TaxID=9823 RepID=A0A8D0IDW2_PIG
MELQATLAQHHYQHHCLLKDGENFEKWLTLSTAVRSDVSSHQNEQALLQGTCVPFLQLQVGRCPRQERREPTCHGPPVQCLMKFGFSF